MKLRYFKALFVAFAALCFNINDSEACTSVIVSGKANSTGKPFMFKNRDTGELNNRMEYFKGPLYAFIGLVNSPHIEKDEVWAGTNETGFSIINTASYNIKDDDIPANQMDCEGYLMFKALGVCASVKDFECFLDTLSKPMHVEANFGVIDANGGAAYYEVNNYKWIKYDVNDASVAPEGYRVVTNFSESGRKEDYEGWERYLTASAVMKELPRDKNNKLSIDHNTIMNGFSRCYRHEFVGLENIDEYDVFVDQDFIPRRSTSAVIAVEGVKPGENPKYTVMWTMIGYPATTVAIPLMVGNSDIIPYYMKQSSESDTNCSLCDFALGLKERIFRFKISNGSHYFDAAAVRDMIKCGVKAEKFINSDFSSIYEKWTGGKLSDDDFYGKYARRADIYYQKYVSAFASFAKND